jgi:ketosteroid isomerase-like protein
MPVKAVPEPSGPATAVLEANQRFYAAFQSLNIERMSAIWLAEDWVQCVHPGWDLLIGWDEIRESWARIFSNTRRIQIALSSVRVHVEGNVAWVACTEHITSAFENSFDEALVQATNMFVRREGSWHLVAHHASPLLSAPVPKVQ